MSTKKFDIYSLSIEAESTKATKTAEAQKVSFIEQLVPST